MKTTKFWLVIALGAVLTSLFFTSCKKDPVEEIINSQVLESGVNKNVTEKSVDKDDGSKGTVLSYESWIMLAVQTRASFDRKVSVTLNSNLSGFSQEIKVTDFEITSTEANISYKITDIKRQEDYVSVRDSILVYTVTHNNFTFSFELGNEFGLYDDGVTKQKMPSISIGDIVDKGYKVEIQDSKPEGEVVYARKKYTHTIGVKFNGKEYDVVANIILKKQIAMVGSRYLVRSVVISKSSVPVQQMGKHVSSMLVRRLWSDGVDELVTHEVNLTAYVGDEVMPYTSLNSYDGNLSIVSSSPGPIERGYRNVENEFVEVFRCKQQLYVTLNLFSVHSFVYYDEAVYYDGINREAFESHKLESMEAGKFTFEKNETGVENGVPFAIWWFNQEIKAKVGTVECVGSSALQVTVM